MLKTIVQRNLQILDSDLDFDYTLNNDDERELIVILYEERLNRDYNDVLKTTCAIGRKRLCHGYRRK
ncbi:5234_t:CDS:2 [Funneliformis mosseae]|uniref:5234_t:CDS:1 n=1 Tax=Funneliformis mosseae TaxID=27381 RepID=A0A9N8ZXL1_FUNMO|nr:5234_t:CDS:2 [Funneliformis mosseae]